MKASAHYLKIVGWSDEDQCFVGSCPGLFYGGCHGDVEQQVFAELCQMVDEMIALYQQDRKPLPPPTYGRDLVAQLADTATGNQAAASFAEREPQKVADG